MSQERNKMSSNQQISMNEKEEIINRLTTTFRKRYNEYKKVYDKACNHKDFVVDKKETSMRIVRNEAWFFKALIDRNKDEVMKLQKKYVELNHKFLEESNGTSIVCLDGKCKKKREQRVNTDAGYLMKCDGVKQNYEQREGLYNSILQLDFYWI